MAYMTDRKRAEGLGSAHGGTEHHWSMTINSAALVVLIPLFVFTFGPILGEPYEEVARFYSRPFPAIVAALTFVVGFYHFALGVRVLIDDYLRGAARKWSIVAAQCVSYAALATGVFAVARLAF